MKYSILFKNEYELNKNMPDFFVNINADQVVNAILRNDEDKSNKSIFYTPLKFLHFQQNIYQKLL